MIFLYDILMAELKDVIFYVDNENTGYINFDFKNDNYKILISAEHKDAKTEFIYLLYKNNNLEKMVISGLGPKPRIITSMQYIYKYFSKIDPRLFCKVYDVISKESAQLSEKFKKLLGEFEKYYNINCKIEYDSIVVEKKPFVLLNKNKKKYFKNFLENVENINISRKGAEFTDVKTDIPIETINPENIEKQIKSYSPVNELPKLSNSEKEKLKHIANIGINRINENTEKSFFNNNNRKNVISMHRRRNRLLANEDLDLNKEFIQELFKKIKAERGLYKYFADVNTIDDVERSYQSQKNGYQQKMNSSNMITDWEKRKVYLNKISRDLLNMHNEYERKKQNIINKEQKTKSNVKSVKTNSSNSSSEGENKRRNERKRKIEEEKKKFQKAEEEYKKSEERLFAQARLGRKPSSSNLNETVTKTNAERKKKNNKVDILKLATGQMQDSIVREGLGRTLEDIRSKNDKLVSNSEVAALRKKRQAAKAARAAKV